jgi:phosphatidylinositol-3-phosphatase
LLALCLLVAGACGQSQARVQTSPSPVVSGISVDYPAAATPSPFTNQSHVFIIVMENRSYAQAIIGGYTASLARRYGVAANYHGVSHPSLPNYLAMTSGSTWGIADDGYHPLPATGLGEQLTQAGIPWRAYMENMPASCLLSAYPYALKHDPFPYYGNRCPPQVVNFSRFSADMKSGDVPRFVWITPNLCNDGHDCSTAVADRWMSQVVPQILATAAWQQHGVLLITWDEGEDSANHVLTLVVRPNMQPSVSNRYYDHYSLLATIEDILGVPRLGAAVRASPMRDLVVSASAQS